MVYINTKNRRKHQIPGEEARMAVEIELKVRLDDPGPVTERLDSLGARIRSYEKSDVYWHAAANGMARLPPAGLRVRRENALDAEGRGSATVLVTYKTKETRDGIEINDEREFAVTGAEVFEDLLARLGLCPGIRKEKRGRAWDLGGRPPVLAELAMVGGLGWFLELEILAESRDERSLAESRNRLLSLLAALDIPPERIESRPYTEMLAGRNHAH
jgi:adenylate cyclase class 2